MFSEKIVFIVVGSVHSTQKRYYNYLLDSINKLGIKNFFFLGSRSDVRPLLKAMNIYICSSENESSPLSLWEAMSMKKAIVSTDVGDVKTFIENVINGFVGGSDNDIELTKYLKKLIEDPKLRDKLGENAREKAKSKLDLKICTNLHYKMYKSVINN